MLIAWKIFTEYYELLFNWPKRTFIGEHISIYNVAIEICAVLNNRETLNVQRYYIK